MTTSKPLNFLIAPDFPPSNYAGWHMLNTLVQRRSGLRLRLLMPGDLKEQRHMLETENIDIVYANPFDATQLVRENGYIALAKPKLNADEVVIAARQDASWSVIEDLKTDCRIAVTPNGDIKLLGLRLLEPADLTEDNVKWVSVESYQGVARLLIKGEVDVGLFLASAFHSLSKLSKSQLKILVESNLHDISHVFLVNPIYAQELTQLQNVLLDVGQQPGDHEILEALGLPNGFVHMGQEDAEFMIDLMETLID